MGTRKVVEKDKYMRQRRYRFQSEDIEYVEIEDSSDSEKSTIPSSDVGLMLEFCRIKNEECEIEGCFSQGRLREKVYVAVKIDGRLVKSEYIKRRREVLSPETSAVQLQGFRVIFPLDVRKNYSLKFYAVTKDGYSEWKKLTYRQFFPVTNAYDHSYYKKDGWALTQAGNRLFLKRCGYLDGIWKELRFCAELWRKNREGGRKAVFARTLYHMLKPLKQKQLWLVSDRTMKAGDNGDAIFRYLQAHPRKDRRVIFYLNAESPDYHLIKKVGPVVGAYTWRRKLLHLLCDLNISSQADNIQANPFLGYQDAYRDILTNIRYIYLQHGIMQSNLAHWLGRYNKNIFRIVTSTEHENRIILNGGYGYTAENLWLAGSPRFDQWYHDEQRKVTIMPTWREYLASQVAENGAREVDTGFEESEYFHFYNKLINHNGLLAAASKYHYQLQFMPHPHLQPSLSAFHRNNQVKFLGTDAICADVYAQSDLLITDYSSVGFDFAYLRKPVIYCQFDAVRFFSGEHTYDEDPLNFNYEKDGFGEVEYDLESTVNRIIEYMQDGCQLKEKYRRRIDAFFAFDDQNNCERVVKKLEEIAFMR